MPVGAGAVLDPSSGFPTSDASVAYQERLFTLRTALPDMPVQSGSYRIVSAAGAYRRLRDSGANQHDVVAPLIVTRVSAAHATFLTDRGRRRLPAWQFFFQGVADPASVLAVAAPGAFIVPGVHQFGPGGTGNSDEDSATVSPSGQTVTISFAGAPAGTGPCEANYRASAITSRQAVAFTITTIAAPVPAGQACPALAVIRTAVLHLAQPLGARVLLSSADGGAIEVAPVRFGG